MPEWVSDPKRRLVDLTPEERAAFAREMSKLFADVCAPIRAYLRAHYHHNGDIDFTGRHDPIFYDVLNLEFGLGLRESESMTLPQSHALLRFDHQWKTAPSDDDRRRVLVEVAELRDQLAILPDLADSARSFLKALRRFPDPKPNAR
jgi:hypothetical protein